MLTCVPALYPVLAPISLPTNFPGTLIQPTNNILQADYILPSVNNPISLMQSQL
jgi:hypothetical protein